MEPPPRTRRGYLDWLRGLAVLIMIEAHVIDSWTRAADRDLQRLPVVADARRLWRAALSVPRRRQRVVVGRLEVPQVRRRRAAATAAVARRGLEIFGLAFLFRLQACLLSWGPWWSLLKVDILNIMGPSHRGGRGCVGRWCGRLARALQSSPWPLSPSRC